MFTSIARSYDRNNRIHSFGLDRCWRTRAVRLAKARPGDHVLDVACGTGDLSEAFARAGVSQVTGVDFTPAMIDLARAKAARFGGNTTTVPQYMVADAQELPFEDGLFQVVSIAFGLRNVQEPSRALNEFYRVLSPGGRLVILEFSEPENRFIRWGSRIWTDRIMPITATMIAGDRSGAYRYLPRSIATFADSQSLVSMMEGAGFQCTEPERLTLGICTIHVGCKPT